MRKCRNNMKAHNQHPFVFCLFLSKGKFTICLNSVCVRIIIIIIIIPKEGGGGGLFRFYNTWIVQGLSIHSPSLYCTQTRMRWWCCNCNNMCDRRPTDRRRRINWLSIQFRICTFRTKSNSWISAQTALSFLPPNFSSFFLWFLILVLVILCII